MNKRFLTCIICPMGCRIEIGMTNNTIDYISGNNCSRGKQYAINECTNPVRTLTTTIKCENGEILPVKSDKPIPKNKLFECMEVINRTTAVLPLSAGDVIIDHILNTNANIIAVKDSIGY